MQPLEGDAFVVRNIGGRPQCAAPGKVVGAGADDPADIAQLARDQIAIRQLADPDRDIDMRLDDVDRGIGQHQSHGDIGVGREERMHHRCDMELAEHDGRGDEEFSARHAVFAAGRAFGIGEIFEQPPR